MAGITPAYQWLHKDLRLIAKILLAIALGPADGADRETLLREAYDDIQPARRD
jgi:hypothetical protein